MLRLCLALKAQRQDNKAIPSFAVLNAKDLLPLAAAREEPPYKSRVKVRTLLVRSLTLKPRQQLTRLSREDSLLEPCDRRQCGVHV